MVKDSNISVWSTILNFWNRTVIRFGGSEAITIPEAKKFGIKSKAPTWIGWVSKEELTDLASPDNEFLDDKKVLIVMFKNDRQNNKDSK